MSIFDGSTQFVPVAWLELAAWNRPMIVYSRTIPDPQPAPEGWLSVPQPENCKVPFPPRIRPAA